MLHLNFCRDPVIDKNTMQIACKHHMQINQRVGTGVMFNNLFARMIVNCQVCKKQKYYCSYSRHYFKCLRRLRNTDEILNSFDFCHIQDKEKYICSICGKLDMRIFICPGCEKQKCIRCRIDSNEIQCKKLKNFNFGSIQQNCQLQCKAIFCRKYIKMTNSYAHYKQCHFRLKKCRCNKCNWSGFNGEYKNHECIWEEDKLLNQIFQCGSNLQIELKKKIQLLRMIKTTQNQLNIH